MSTRISSSGVLSHGGKGSTYPISWGDKAKIRKEQEFVENRIPNRPSGKKKRTGLRRNGKAAGVGPKSVRLDKPSQEISSPSKYVEEHSEVRSTRADNEDFGQSSQSKLEIDVSRTGKLASDSIPWLNMNLDEEELLTSLDALGKSNNHSESGKVLSPPPSSVMEPESLLDNVNNRFHHYPPAPIDSMVTAVMTVEGRAGDSKNGAYIVRDEKGGRWIFKPFEEEGVREDDDEWGDRALTHGVNELLPGTSAELSIIETGKIPLKQGVIWGETVKKEQAAYQLDHDHFAGVPVTYALHLLTGQDGKPQFQYGSLQQWKENIGSTEDHGEGIFPTEDVHKIGILDIRLLNLDRHMGNILVANDKKNGGHQLIPIDHGFILPDFRNLSDTTFEWLNFRQCKQSFSPETKEYINKLDIFADARRLKSLDIRDEAVLGSMTSTLLLKRGAQQDLTLYDMGNMIQRRGIRDEKSCLEQMIDRTLEKVERVLQQENGASPTQLTSTEFSSSQRQVTADLQSLTNSCISEDSQGRNMQEKPHSDEHKSNSLAPFPLSRSRSWAHFQGNKSSYLRKADEILRSLLIYIDSPRGSDCNRPQLTANNDLKRSTSAMCSLRTLENGFKIQKTSNLGSYQPMQSIDEPLTPLELRLPLSGSSPPDTDIRVTNHIEQKSGTHTNSSPQIKRSSAIGIPGMEKNRKNVQERSHSDLSSSPGSIINLSSSPLGFSPPDPAAQVARDVILPSWTWHDHTKKTLHSDDSIPHHRGVPLPGRYRWLKLYFKYISQEIDIEIDKCLKFKLEEAAKLKLTQKRRKKVK